MGKRGEISKRWRDLATRIVGIKIHKFQSRQMHGLIEMEGNQQVGSSIN